MDCGKCKLDHETRKRWSCAWLPKRERSGKGYRPADYPHEQPEVCAGYLTGLPQVIEAARAASWRRDGALGQFYEEPLTELAKVCIDIMDAELKAVEQYTIRERSKPKG